jgi:hypothetical protein
MIAPPGQAPGSAADSEAQALFAEARRRRRRRRIAGAAVTLAVAGLVATGLAGGGSRHGPPHRIRSGPRPAAVVQPRVPGFTLPAAHVAWVDYSGQLHIGDVATGAQHVVANVLSGDGGGWFVRAGEHLYWPDFDSIKNIVAIRDYDLATGKIQYLGRGESVFASADGRHVYVMRSRTALIELRAGGSGAPRPLTVPAGWHLDFPSPITLARGGIAVTGNGDRADAFSSGIAIWYPRVGQLRRISTGGDAIAGYTPRHGRHGLLAWAPPRCPRGDCVIKITNTATMATITVRSPLHHGFTESDGTFSPDGRQLAVFIRRASISSSWPNHSELAIVNTRTGHLRIVRAARLVTQEDAGWVLWLPGGKRLLVGALSFSYAVDAKTLAARPFFFVHGTSDHDIMDTPDINFSATLLPPGTGQGPIRKGAGRAP